IPLAISLDNHVELIGRSRISNRRPTLSMLERSVKRRGSSAEVALACASPFAFRMRPFAHGDLDDVAQRRRVAEHLVQDSDAFGDADIEAGNGPRVGGGIENAFGLTAPQRDVDGAFDAGGSPRDGTKDPLPPLPQPPPPTRLDATPPPPPAPPSP